MTPFTENRSRWYNLYVSLAILGILASLVVLIVFVVAIFRISEAKDVASALGNVVGGALGAVGAAGAVFWQLDRKRREELAELNALRRMAYKPIVEATFFCLANHRKILRYLKKFDPRMASQYFQNIPYGKYFIDERFRKQLIVRAPLDIHIVDTLADTVKMLSEFGRKELADKKQVQTDLSDSRILIDIIFDEGNHRYSAVASALNTLEDTIATERAFYRGIGSVLPEAKTLIQDLDLCMNWCREIAPPVPLADHEWAAIRNS